MPTTEAGTRLIDSIAAIEAEAAAAERVRISAAVEGTPRLRLTGAQLAALPAASGRGDFCLDFDEWDEWVPLSILRAVIVRDSVGRP